MRIARLDRRTNAWTTARRSRPTSIPRARRASATGRSKVAISADGVGVVTWGEGGHVFARKMFNSGISNAPQDLTPPDFDGRVATVSDLPDVDAEDDSSYAWVVFRQTFADGGSRTLARRQRGTAFDPPVAVDTGDEPVTRPAHRPQRPRPGPRDVGAARAPASRSRRCIDKRDAFAAGAAGSSRRAPPAAVVVPAISENNMSVVAAVLGGGAARRRSFVRPLRRRHGAARTISLSRAELGAGRPGRAASTPRRDRAGGVVVAWVQGAPADRRIVAGYFDRPPATLPRLHRPGLLPRRRRRR